MLIKDAASFKKNVAANMHVVWTSMDPTWCTKINTALWKTFLCSSICACGHGLKYRTTVMQSTLLTGVLSGAVLSSAATGSHVPLLPHGICDYVKYCIECPRLSGCIVLTVPSRAERHRRSQSPEWQVLHSGQLPKSLHSVRSRLLLRQQFPLALPAPQPTSIKLNPCGSGCMHDYLRRFKWYKDLWLCD